jgi:hypothetical protein
MKDRIISQILDFQFSKSPLLENFIIILTWFDSPVLDLTRGSAKARRR